ncbi:MAG: hypothetical protein RLZZ337_1617 [Bacteroidota bacterium]|jgi:hypothetical protein
MKNFKNILVLSLILDLLQSFPLLLAMSGGEMKEMMIADMGVEGLAKNAGAIAILDTMLFVFAFIMLGYLAATIYALTLKELSSLKAATFLLGILHVAWTLPDFISLLMGSSAHAPIPLMIVSLLPIIGLFYVARNGKLKTSI